MWKKKDKKSTRLINGKGFSLVGVLSASAVGLIVVAGMSQMFVNMGGQIADLEKKAKSAALIAKIGTQLNSSCKASLIDYSSNIRAGTSSQFNQIKNLDNTVFLDLSDAASMRSQYGMEGHLQFLLSCKNSGGCSCINGPHPCSKQWTLDLISQRRKQGVLIYNKEVSYDLNIQYTKAPDPSYSYVHQGGTSQNRAYGNFSCSPNEQFITNQILTAIGIHVGSSCFMNNNSPRGCVFVGKSAGENNQAFGNTFVGSFSGHKNTSGYFNTFIGEKSGINNITGERNTFVGERAGDKNTTGGENVFIGILAGGQNTTEEYNTYIGNWTGQLHTGSNNVMIGHGAGNNLSNKTANNLFVVGNRSDSVWIKGTFGGSSLRVNGSETVNASSRTLKKNIRPFQSIEKSLEDILQTPLFTYQYREKSLHPDKKRMGIIAEDLPKSLQLPVKDRVEPDWPSVYGTLWAGIKALNSKIEELIQKLQIDTQKTLEEAFKKNKKEHSEKDKKIFLMEKKLKQNREEIQNLKKELRDIHLNVQKIQKNKNL